MTLDEIRNIIGNALKKGTIRNYQRIGKACLSNLEITNLKYENIDEYYRLKYLITKWIDDYDHLKAYSERITDAYTKIEEN